MNAEVDKLDGAAQVASLVAHAETWPGEPRNDAVPNGERRDDTEEPRQSQANVLLRLASAAALFHTPSGWAGADVEVKGHRETWSLRSNGFRRWLIEQFFRAEGTAPRPEAISTVLDALEAMAHFDNPEYEVFVRVGTQGTRIYLDLCDEQWRAVEVDASGWRVVTRPPIRFRRTPGMRPLRTPESGGSVEELRSFLNVRSQDDFVLVVAWLLAGLRGRGPYPLLVLAGEQGSAKSTFCGVLRALIDPNTAPLRALPREERDVFIAATNAHVLAFDNVSNLQPWLSDTLCRLSTGGAFAARQLYTDQEEVLFNAVRPIILNGIEEMVTRPDLADRSIFLTLNAIPETRRKPEADLLAAFDAKRGQLLGALLDGLVEGLRRVEHVSLPGYPRMADFARWATACEPAFWPAGSFQAAYGGNRNDAVESVLEADPVAQAIRLMMSATTEWSGTASELLAECGMAVDERVRQAKSWPGSPKALADRLRRLATFLRKVGVDIAFTREGKARTRTICLKAWTDPRPEEAGPGASAASAATAQSESRQIRADANSQGVTAAAISASAGDGHILQQEFGADAADAADAMTPASDLHADGLARCCAGTAFELRCKLCPNSPTYWRKAELGSLLDDEEQG